MKHELFETIGTTLAYADSHDTLLGIGLAMRSHDANKHERWQGRNILGYVLTDIRDELLSKLQVIIMMIIIIRIVLLECKLLPVPVV